MEGRPRSLKLTWSLRLSAPLLIALTLPAFSTRTIFAAELQNSEQAREIQGNLALKGEHLHADIKAKYKELMSTKSYARENDVTSIVQKYVSPTMSIEDIKLVLRSAGLGDPGLTVDGHLLFLWEYWRVLVPYCFALCCRY